MARERRGISKSWHRCPLSSGASSGRRGLHGGKPPATGFPWEFSPLAHRGPGEGDSRAPNSVGCVMFEQREDATSPARGATGAWAEPRRVQCANAPLRECPGPAARPARLHMNPPEGPTKSSVWFGWRLRWADSYLRPSHKGL